MIETDHAADKTFRANFFRDFKTILNKFPPVRLLPAPSGPAGPDEREPGAD